jgi:MFS family permease
VAVASIDDAAMRSIGSVSNSSGSFYGNAELLVMALTHFANHVYTQIHLTLIPVFMEEFGLSLAHVGIMVMIPMLSEAIATVPSGLLADRLGYFRQVIISLGMTAGAALLMTQAQTPYSVVLALSLLAISTTIYHPPAYGAVSQMFQERRNRALGIHGAGGTLGWALGPFSVGVLLNVGWRSVYLLWIPPTLLCIFLLARMKSPETTISRRSERPESSVKSVFTIGLLIALSMIAINSMGRQIVSTLTSPYVVLARRFTVQEASYIMGAMSLTGIIAAPIGGLLADKLGERKWLTMTMTAAILALLAFIRAETIPTLLLCAVAYGYLVYSGMGASAALISYFTPLSRRGLGYALYFLPSYIVGAVAPVVGTTLAESYGIWTPLSLAVAFLAAAVIVLQRIPVSRR